MTAPDTLAVEGTVTLRDAHAATGASVSAMRKAIRAGRLPSLVADGPNGPERRVRVADVVAAMPAATAGARAPIAPPAPPRDVVDAELVEEAPPAPATLAAPATVPAEGTLAVPLEEWRRVLDTVATLHAAGVELGEARARIAHLERELAGRDRQLEAMTAAGSPRRPWWARLLTPSE